MCVYSCMILESPISRLSSALSDTFLVLFSVVYSYISHPLVVWFLILMMIMSNCLLLDNPHHVAIYFLVIIFSPGHPVDKVLYLSRALDPSIEVWQMLLLRLVGFIIYFASFLIRLFPLLWFIVIMFVLFTCLPTQINITQNIEIDIYYVRDKVAMGQF